MAKRSCPCGCGRAVGLTKRGAAVGVDRVDSLVTVATPALEAIEQSSSPSSGFSAEKVQFLADVGTLRGSLLDHIHGTARPGSTPNLMDLHKRIEQLEKAVARIVSLGGSIALDASLGPGEGRDAGGPDDETMYVPRPVELVARRMEDLLEIYAINRRDLEPLDAATAALYSAFTEEQADDVVSFANGEQDGTYGKDSGTAFLDTLLENLETYYTQARAKGWV